MSVIRETQEDILIRDALNSATQSENDLSIAQLQAMITHVKVSDLIGKPLFPANILNRIEKIDFNKHNENVAGLRYDAEVVMTTMNWINTTITKATAASDKMRTFIADIISKLRALIRQASIRLRASAKTITIDFSSNEHTDSDNTTAVIDLENQVCTLPVRYNVGQININNMDESDVSVSFQNDIPVGTNHSLFTLLRPANDKPINIRAFDGSNTLTEINGSIVVRLNKDGYNKTINALTIEVANSDAITISATAIYGVDKTREIVPENLVTSGTYTFTFEQIDASSIEIKLNKKKPDIIESNRRQFIFAFTRIVLENTSFQNEGTFQTVAIPAGMSVTDIMLRTRDYIPAGADINYYVSNDGTRWIEVDPLDTKISTRNLVSLGSKNTVSIDDITESNNSRWSTLKQHTRYGNKPLYNILEKANDSDFVAEDVLTISGSTTDEVDLPSIRLNRGYDNYAIDKTTLELDVEVQDIRYIFEDDTDNNTVELLDIFTRIDNEAKVVQSGLIVELQYTPANDDIYVSDGTTKITIVERTGKTLRLSGTSGAATNKLVHVTYHTKLSEIEQDGRFIISIDPDSFEVKRNPGDTPVPPTDYQIDPIGRTIALSENTTIGTSAGTSSTRRVTVSIGSGTTSEIVLGVAHRTAYITFTYTIKTKDKYNICTTHVFYQKETKITIYPFTEEEIKAGNFHIIDGINVSSTKTYVMSSGWHDVRSTQPYKTDPGNGQDVNELTSDVSSAGINLGNYEEMLAFDKALRLVSTKALSNIIGPKDHRSFAYDNGSLLVNYLPESLPEEINIYESHVKGTDILGKRAIYTADGDFDYYEVVPDKYKLVLNTKKKVDDADAVTDVYLKVELTRDGKKTYQTPEIEKIEILLL